MTMRVLEVAHAWEGRGAGGAERSAAALTDALRQLDDVSAQLAACVRRRDTSGNSHFGYDARADVLLVNSVTDWETFTWRDVSTAQTWRRVLTTYQPDVVHLHHYSQVGIELPRLVHQVLPNAVVALTLHEYLAMCPRSGQLLDRAGRLCAGPSPRACAWCMEWTVDHVARREHYVRAGLAGVDVFISPSEFLAHRYTEWGIPADRVHVVPNALSPLAQVDRAPREPGAPVRVAFLGQHTPFKGLVLLLDSLAAMPDDQRRRLHVDVYGSGAHRFGEEFEASVHDHPALALPNVSLRGAYANPDVAHILAATDVLIVPSTWFENSPVVIEEALAAGVPVLCSDIGGMAEKVRNGVDGWHFRAGDAGDLTAALSRLATDGVTGLSGQMRAPISDHESALRHVELFREAAQQR